jgi:phytoene synthase
MKTSLPTASDFAVCRALQRRHGTSYALATRFFPTEKRLATEALYAFFRVPDDLVDVAYASDGVTAKQKLEQFERNWRDWIDSGESTDPVLRCTAWAFRHFSIPMEYGEAFLDAMKQDAEVDRYETYTDLEGYMYGSAVVVGLMMSYVVGFSGKKALVHAQALGEAMQLTNFLRDIGEDWRERQRIYLPLEDLKQFNVTEKEVAQGVQSEQMKDLLRFEIKRADALYAAAEPGITLLSKDGQFAVRAASRLYQNILREIERNDYDVFTKRARTSKMKKLQLLLSAFLH